MINSDVAAAEISKSRPRIRIWPWGLVGFGLGILSSGAYLLLGGDYFWNIPRYARVLFYPGFAAGNMVYDWGLRLALSQAVGVLAVGVAYGLTALFLAFASRIDAEFREANDQTQNKKL